MEKIKLNTPTSGVLEKPLVTAFKSNGGEFVVLDNEINGTMGLPIILVSKLVNNKLEVVPDVEWNVVKEVLRQIISGNQVDYIAVADTLNADNMFFKQLTLPVASFDALKNGYKPLASAPAAPVESSIPASPSSPVESKVVEPINQPAATPVEPVMPAAPIRSQVVAPVVPEVEVDPTPSVEPIPEQVPATPIDFTADKEAFLKACENMFDALVAKFNK